MDRRAFLQQGALMLTAAAVSARALADDESPPAEPLVRIGLVTDLHHADKGPAGSRVYRDTLRKFDVAAQQFKKDKVDLVVELGDFIDAADSIETEKAYLVTATKAFAATPGEHHYVLGNHCVSALTKPEFLEIVGQKKSYYSFDRSGYHFVVLDACFRSDGEPYGRNNFQWTDPNLPPAEVEWLRADLAKTTGKTVVFIHQRLDTDDHYAVKNAPEVRTILEQSGQVLAVLQGHYHRNALQQIGGIPYCTLAAMIEQPYPENAYGVLEILPKDVLRIRGFGKQVSYEAL